MKRDCTLCGYPSEAYLVLEIPLSSPPKDNAICTECLEEIQLELLEILKRNISKGV